MIKTLIKGQNIMTNKIVYNQLGLETMQAIKKLIKTYNSKHIIKGETCPLCDVAYGFRGDYLLREYIKSKPLKKCMLCPWVIFENKFCKQYKYKDIFLRPEKLSNFKLIMYKKIRIKSLEKWLKLLKHENKCPLIYKES